MTDTELRQLYNRLYQQYAMRETYRVKHILDDKSVGLNWSELMKYTCKVEGVMFRGRDGMDYVKFS